MAKLTEGQVVLWFEQAGTEALRAFLERKRVWLYGVRGTTFFAGDAYRTQEAIISINARLEEVHAFLQLLTDRELFLTELTLEEDPREPERLLSGGLPGIGQA